MCLRSFVMGVLLMTVMSSGIGAHARAEAIACCPIVEIRQYTLAPGSFNDFRDLFERNFVESQEADGMTIVGTFRVLDDPNRFFWVRGFASMDARKRALTAFYGGPVWKEYRGIANPMLVENDNVLLLHPAHAGSGFSIDTAARRPVGSKAEPSGLVVATIYSLGLSDGEKFDAFFEHSIRPVLTAAGASVLATFATEHIANNFPKLPIREDANAFAWFSCFQDEVAFDRYQAAVAADPRWLKIRESFALLRMYSPPEVWRLAATPRSVLHC